MTEEINVSIVVPLFNESESLPELHRWIQRVMQDHSMSYEIIFIDDGSKDGSWNIIEDLRRLDSHVK
jgi:glycosyltransferase involved in cell wall biosynthesis